MAEPGANSAIQEWAENQEFAVQLDVHRRIIDFLEPDKTRPNTSEERVRQILARILHYDLGYPKDHMKMDAVIDIGRESKRADLVVYHSAIAQKQRDQSKIAIIVETKAENVRDGHNQLFSYVFASSAEGAIWTNGADIVHWRRQQFPQELLRWPGVPRYGRSWQSVGRYKKKDLRVPHNLNPIFRKCHNALYRGGISSEDVALDMVRILLAKLHDEERPGDDCDFHCTPEELQSDDGRRQVAMRVQDLFEEVKQSHRDVFETHERVTARHSDVAVVVALLQEYNLLEADYDVIGTAYETYVASHLRGERGQFFTPRSAVRLLVRLVGPQEDDIILDPACGSAGFLIECLSHLRNLVARSNRSQAGKQQVENQIRQNLFGIDISPRLVKVAQANMLIGKDGHSNIVRADSLRQPFGQLPKSFIKRCGFGMPTIILTNPPFGSSADHRVTDRSILEGLQIGRSWTWNEDEDAIEFSDELNPGLPPELLFLERCIQWAAPGGRIGIVMARGQLDNKEARAARYFALRQCRLIAVINCHEDAFEPHVGSKASLLVLEKKREYDESDYAIYMAISKKCGHTSRGVPIFKRSREGDLITVNGQPVIDHDLEDIFEGYQSWRNGQEILHSYAFSIRRSQIKGPSYSLNPVHYLPQFEQSRQAILCLGESQKWEVRRLGDIAAVFNGPRFRRPYADEGVTTGDGILPYFTGTAMTQTKGENIKYLDKRKADTTTKKHLEKLLIHEGWILITDSGTLGRVIWARQEHDGAIATNNLIRVVIEDPLLRAYVYQFLQSRYGQDQMLRNEYGTNQSHLEPEHIQELLIPIPKDQDTLRSLAQPILESIDALQHSTRKASEADTILHSQINASLVSVAQD